MTHVVSFPSTIVGNTSRGHFTVYFHWDSNRSQRFLPAVDMEKMQLANLSLRDSDKIVLGGLDNTSYKDANCLI